MPTTNVSTYQPSGGDYSSATTWESTEERDISSGGSDEIEILRAQSDWSSSADSTTLTFAWTAGYTDATNYAEIQTDASNAPVQTAPDTSRFRRSARIHAFRGHLHATGIPATASADYAFYSENDGFMTCYQCVGYGSTYGFRLGSASTATGLTCSSCIAYENSSGFRIQAGGTANATLDNCTAAENTGVGVVRSGGTLDCHNTLSADNSSDDFNGTVTGSEDYNASSDASAVGSNSLTTVTVTWTDNANDDYSISSTSADITAEGSATYSPAADFFGTSYAATPSIGAEELDAAVAAGTHLVTPHDRIRRSVYARYR